MSSLAWVVSKSYMWEHAYAYLGICNSMQMCASFVFMQKYAHILFSLNLPYILAYRPSNFGQYFFPKLMGRLIRKPTFNINKGHLFWTFLQPNLGGRLIFGSAYMRVYTVSLFQVAETPKFANNSTLPFGYPQWELSNIICRDSKKKSFLLSVWWIHI